MMPEGMKGFQKGNTFGNRFQKGQSERKGPNHPNCKGGKYIHNGYVMVLTPDHPRYRKVYR